MEDLNLTVGMEVLAAVLPIVHASLRFLSSFDLVVVSILKSYVEITWFFMFSMCDLQIIKLMQSFNYKEYVREIFPWKHCYWHLTNDGIGFLRTYLTLPSNIIPATLRM